MRKKKVYVYIDHDEKAGFLLEDWVENEEVQKCWNELPANKRYLIVDEDLWRLLTDTSVPADDTQEARAI